ncbi:hypothetical protein [Gemella haemolysans]|uniref:hypothetical protein n=1 Tax=Gemella haemolysans TaxID=1379 RepID=UPI0028D19E64|nr:hypothetical protein [Gemella haemolysans]
MRKNYLKGQLNFIILTLMVWFAAIYIAKDNILQLTRGIETQYSKEGAYEPGEAGYAVVKIIKIEETNIEDEDLFDEKFYLVEFEKGFTMLKATPEKVKEMLGDSINKDRNLYNIGDKPIYAKIDGVPERTGRRNTTRSVPEELQKKFVDAYRNSEIFSKRLEKVTADYKKGEDITAIKNREKERPFYADTYIKPLGSSFHLFQIVGNALILWVALWMTKILYRRMLANKARYEKLFLAYPETERDLDVIRREAEYLNREFKVLIYKEMFISYYSDFIAQYIDDIKSIEVIRIHGKDKIFYHMEIKLTNGGEDEAYFPNDANEEQLKIFVDTLRDNYGINAKLIF